MNEVVTVRGNEVVTARRSVHDQPPRLLYRIMDTWILRKAPWLVFFFMFCVAVGVTVMCVRLRLGDDVTASICAALTCGLILGSATAVWLSLRRQGGETAIVRRKRKRVTVSLKAHDLDVSNLCCPICLVEMELGE